MFAASHVVHIKVDLSQAAAYDDLFPPSLFDEPTTQPPDDVGLFPEDLPRTAAAEGTVSIADEAFEDVEEVNPFVGKTQVSGAKYHILFLNALTMWLGIHPAKHSAPLICTGSLRIREKELCFICMYDFFSHYVFVLYTHCMHHVLHFSGLLLLLVFCYSVFCCVTLSTRMFVHLSHSITRRRSWECLSLPSEFLQTPPFRKIFKGSCLDCPWKHARQI